MYVNLIILYKQFNFGLVPQTFELATSSNSLPEGQPHLFIFVSSCAQSRDTFSNHEATTPPELNAYEQLQLSVACWYFDFLLVAVLYISIQLCYLV